MPQHIVFSRRRRVDGVTNRCGAGPARGQTLQNLLAGVERRAVLFAIQECGGDREGARFLGLDGRPLEEKLRLNAGEGREDLDSDAPASDRRAEGICSPEPGWRCSSTAARIV